MAMSSQNRNHAISGIALSILALTSIAPAAQAALNETQIKTVQKMIKTTGSPCSEAKKELTGCISKIRTSLGGGVKDKDIQDYLEANVTWFHSTPTVAAVEHTPPTHKGPGGKELTYTDLDTSYKINAQKAVRDEVAFALELTDYGHKSHGSNFSTPQTLKQIIKNIYGLYKTNDKNGVIAERSVKVYGYDPR